MLRGILGKKIGMTQVFTEEGQRVPVTVLEAGPLHVLAVLKENEKKGHPVNAVEVGFDVVRDVNPELKEKLGDDFNLAKALRLTKPQLGHFKKAGFEKKFGFVKQIKVEEVEGFNVGEILTLKDFEFFAKVDVCGISKGRGFTGVIKRHGQKIGKRTHGSRFHRKPGSMGPSAWPARVFPGKKLAGHHGSTNVTIRNLEVMKVDIERNLLLIKGAIPGANGNYVIVSAS
jgi:large subunit ribosomal protein L3